MTKEKPLLHVENTLMRLGTAQTTPFPSNNHSPRHKISGTDAITPSNTERQSEMSLLKCKKNLLKTINEGIP